MIPSVTYADGIVQKIRVTEVSEPRHCVSWDLEESEPVVPYSSAYWTHHTTLFFSTIFPSLFSFL
jgi:hypothetical protein